MGGGGVGEGGGGGAIELPLLVISIWHYCVASLGFTAELSPLSGMRGARILEKSVYKIYQQPLFWLQYIEK